MKSFKKVLEGILIALRLRKRPTPQLANKTLLVNNVNTLEGKSRNYAQEAKSLKFLHIRSQFDQDVAVTIAYFYDRANQTVYYQVARCSHGDKFCKRVGRAISSGRYAKYGPGYILQHIKSDQDMYENLEILWNPDYNDAQFELE